jgi:predicted permease
MFGLLPALQATKTDLIPALKNETVAGRYSISGLRSGFIIAQVALSFVLLISAGLIINSLHRVQEIGPGFQTENTMVLSVDLIGQGYSEAKGREFYRQMTDHVRSLPGVKAVSLTSYLPLSLDYYGGAVLVEGQPLSRGADTPEAMKSCISLDYFLTMGIPIIAGRDFTVDDKEDSIPVAIINETFARRFWPGQSAIGKRFTNTPTEPMITVVGVAKDAKYFSLSEEPRAFFYRPTQQVYHGEGVLIVRTVAEPGLMMETVKREVKRLDPTVPVYELKTLTEHMRLSTFPLRIGADGVGTFGLLALVLATIGIYGGVAYAVSQRTKEVGIRMALGATRGDIFGLIVKDGMKVAALGLAIGLAAGLVVSRVISSFIYGVGASDFMTFVIVSLSFTLVVLTACCIPARRAIKVDPMVALRHE